MLFERDLADHVEDQVKYFAHIGVILGGVIDDVIGTDGAQHILLPQLYPPP